MFQHNMQESITGEVFIQDIERDIFYQLLHFIYSGRISDPLTESTAQQLLTAADKYDIQDLKKECASFLLPYVNETNAQKMFGLADAFHVKNLKEECERILLLDMQTTNVLNLIIWADLHSAEKVKEAALNFARANSQTLSQSDDYEKKIPRVSRVPDICLEV
jgi:speckle-type POZ protein